MYIIVADLCREHDFFSLIWERLRDQFFAQSVSVRISRIEESDAEVECVMHQRNRFALGEISPPTGGNCPQAEPAFADRQVGIFVSAETHDPSLANEGWNVQLREWLVRMTLVVSTKRTKRRENF